MKSKLIILIISFFFSSFYLGVESRAAAPVQDFIVVHKAKHQLEFYQAGQIMRRYSIDLGWQPIGVKTRALDGRTPEGLYRIAYHNPASHYHLSLGLSYPQASDIGQAILYGANPGADIMLHGRPNGKKSFRSGDWTDGCIAFSNGAIEEIYTLAADGMLVMIDP